MLARLVSDDTTLSACAIVGMVPASRPNPNFCCIDGLADRTCTLSSFMPIISFSFNTNSSDVQRGVALIPSSRISVIRIRATPSSCKCTLNFKCSSNEFALVHFSLPYACAVSAEEVNGATLASLAVKMGVGPRKVSPPDGTSSLVESRPMSLRENLERSPPLIIFSAPPPAPTPTLLAAAFSAAMAAALAPPRCTSTLSPINL
mmetsp:Transcript_27201/g.50145  ORF Transcript_27201/g.50145 Transcript_27201/m.50145 type:complete len:204 (-) Transcript_27201:291-902(-)